MKKCCPPHTYPHRPFWKEKITDEPCHTHKNSIRQFLHDVHCSLFRCPHRKRK